MTGRNFVKTWIIYCFQNKLLIVYIALTISFMQTQHNSCIHMYIKIMIYKKKYAVSTGGMRADTTIYEGFVILHADVLLFYKRSF